MFDTVLVANRGEIAVRIIRTLRRLGIGSAVVHTPDDAAARHVREADIAVALNGRGGYLDIAQVVAAARSCGADAVHPGYGFLSENAAFARAVADAGVVFVGPPAAASESMGDKVRAKETVRANGVPVVPGSSGSGLTDRQLEDAAREVGLPVLLKPSAGGGGKGMRLVRDWADLAEAIASARREARASFGDDTLLVERWIDQPRHIEIQVLADTHANVIHLGERECSLQRRHQKIIEEAPSPALDAGIRAAMGEAAVQAARSCGYVGAGTVEFIIGAANPSEFFFLEMNTRLQVEHPVTELVTGLDLVEQQLRVAAGQPLSLRQEDVAISGHAIEARLYAEDPAKGFLPTGGRVVLLREPSGTGVRVDSGLVEGADVGTAYDPMLAKIIAHGPDRPTALRRLRTALTRTRVLGLTVNTDFLHRLLGDPDVAAGTLDTGLVERNLDALTTVAESATTEAAVAAALAEHTTLTPAATADGWTSPFDAATGWRLGEPAWTVHRFRLDGGEPLAVRLRLPRGARRGDGVEVWEVAVGDEPPVTAAARWTGPDRLAVTRGELTAHYDIVRADGDWWIAAGARTWRAQPWDPVAAAEAAGGRLDGSVTSPMPGTVTLVKATVGQRVSAGETLVVVEAMKMEHALAAPFDGTVERVSASPGDSVGLEELLVVVVPDTAHGGDANESRTEEVGAR